MAFSEIGVLMGITGLYGYGFSYGGPVVLLWGWVLVSIFSNFISLSLGEICSSFPVSKVISDKPQEIRNIMQRDL